MKQKLMDMIECEKPSEELVFNGRTKASDGITYDQYLGDGKAYNTDGTTWYLLVLNHAALRAYMAEQGRKGGKKSKRTITKEQQAKMQAARKAANVKVSDLPHAQDDSKTNSAASCGRCARP